jgi:hypothetical protein
MKKISLLLPTRGRPLFMQRVVESAIETAKHPEDLQFIFYIDIDDELSQAKVEELATTYNGSCWQEDHCTIKYTVGERIVLSKMWNEVYKLADADIVMHCGDDIIFRTLAWDVTVRNKFDEYPDKIAFVHGFDGLQHQSFGTHGFLHRNWVTTVGYFVPPYFSSDYNDTWLNNVADMIGRNCYVEIYTEHMHPGAGKHFYDQTHQDRLKRHFEDNVQGMYEAKLPERQADAEKLKNFIQSYGV